MTAHGDEVRRRRCAGPFSSALSRATRSPSGDGLRRLNPIYLRVTAPTPNSEEAKVMCAGIPTLAAGSYLSRNDRTNPSASGTRITSVDSISDLPLFVLAIPPQKSTPASMWLIDGVGVMIIAVVRPILMRGR
jgi:hypothetical protein